MGSALLSSSCDPNSQLPSKRGGAAVLGLASGMLKRESGFRLCLEASERRCGMCGGGRDTHSGMPTDPDSIVLTQLCAGGKQNLRALQVWVVGPGMKDEAPLLGWHRAASGDLGEYGVGGAAVSSTWMVIRGNRLRGGQCEEAGGSGLGVTGRQPAPDGGPPRGKGSSEGPGAWQGSSWSSREREEGKREGQEEKRR